MTEPCYVATGSSYGAIAYKDHAGAAVKKALTKMPEFSGSGNIGSVLLFLSSAYAHQPQEAIKEAVKAAGTPLVFGCCAVGLFTEHNRFIDAEGAVAMVFGRELGLQPLRLMEQQGIDPQIILNLSSPNAASIATAGDTPPQLGAICTDEHGHGPYSVWQSGRIVEQEFTHVGFAPALEHSMKLAEGIRPISKIAQINKAEDHRLLEVGQMTPIAHLKSCLPEDANLEQLAQSYSLLCAVAETNDPKSIQAGHYELHHVMALNSKPSNQTQEISLAGSIKPGRSMFWALRDPDLAAIIMRKKLQNLSENLSKKPLFGLMFSNIARASDHTSGNTSDIELFKETFPGLPLLGFYSNGEIAPGSAHSGLIHRYATGFAVFSSKLENHLA